MNQSLNELALFAGAGGGILGGLLCGFRTVCAVEHDPYARDVLVARQNDGCLAPFPIWDDVCTFDGRPWRGVAYVVSGGFPCQDISAANVNAKGITGERSGLWREMARIAGEVGPPVVLVENSPMLVGRGLGLVLGDLAALGYDCRWGIVGAHHAAAPHKRDRIWIVAYSSRNEQRWEEQRAERQRTRTGGESIAGADTLRDEGNGAQAHGSIGECGGFSGSSVSDAHGVHDDAGGHGASPSRREWRSAELCGSECEWWLTEPDVGRVAHGVAARVDRLRCLGNGQVPAVVRLAWSLLQPHDLPK